MKSFHFPIGFFLFAISVAEMFYGCSKESNPVTNYIYTHSDSALVGTMVGYVQLYDSSYQNWINSIFISNSSGVLVSIEGTPFKTTTDSTGRWKLSNIPAGTYTIQFSKQGFAMQKIVAYKFIGNGTDLVNTQYLYQIPTLHSSIVLRQFEDVNEARAIDTIYIYPNGDTLHYQVFDSVLVTQGRAIFSGSIKENLGFMEVMVNIFLSRSSAIDPKDPSTFTVMSRFTRIIYHGNYSADISFYRDSLYSAGFKPGDKIYCLAGAMTMQNEYSNYFDIDKGKFIYTGFSPYYSDVKSFILP